MGVLQQKQNQTFPLGFAVSLAPNLSLNTFSTAFLTSSAFAQRRSGMFFTPLITCPRLAHPVTAADVMYLATWLSSSSTDILNPAPRISSSRKHAPTQPTHTTALIKVCVVEWCRM